MTETGNGTESDSGPVPGRVLVTAERLAIEPEKTALTATNRDVGGVVVFEGLVREFSGGDPAASDSLTLEHYPGMTERALEKIRLETSQRWTLHGLTILHRVGTMRPGEVIVAVIACSRHRKNAFEACAFAMDYLKTEAPFWKLEDDGRGQADWVDARESDTRALKRWSGEPSPSKPEL